MFQNYQRKWRILLLSMNINKALKRDKKISKRKNGHVVDSKSVFTIERLAKERALEIRSKRKQKELSEWSTLLDVQTVGN